MSVFYNEMHELELFHFVNPYTALIWDYTQTDTYLHLLQQIQIFVSGLVRVTVIVRWLRELAEFESDTFDITDN
jgi:cytochrome c oxidase assembly factor CtaG